jgi:hypothetical protein
MVVQECHAASVACVLRAAYLGLCCCLRPVLCFLGFRLLLLRELLLPCEVNHLKHTDNEHSHDMLPAADFAYMLPALCINLNLFPWLYFCTTILNTQRQGLSEATHVAGMLAHALKW